MILHLFLYFASFMAIWIGSGFAITAITQISKSTKISSFAVSFLVLGLFTSISEFSVGINSVLEKDPEIFVGNLIGASIVIFTLVIPLLAIFGHNIKITDEFRGSNLMLSLFVIALPVILTVNGNVDRFDSFVSVIMYLLLVIFIESKKGVFEKSKQIFNGRVKIFKELGRVVVGVVIIFIASRFIVDQTIYFSDILHVSPFIISLIIISIGTNLPELSLVARSVFTKNNQIAFGDYVGSAAFNTFLFGLLTFINDKPVVLEKNYGFSLIFLIIGLFLFYLFAKSKNSISKKEGILLLTIYSLFLLTEVYVYTR